mmetsp:Transcript_17997/g.37047  ORF Transcript_17997/g.37047 Transcript_17997/m.37047 type:complete len:222 (+) Transcript_17997:2528-3193(+)
MVQGRSRGVHCLASTQLLSGLDRRVQDVLDVDPDAPSHGGAEGHGLDEALGPAAFDTLGPCQHDGPEEGGHVLQHGRPAEVHLAQTRVDDRPLVLPEVHAALPELGDRRDDVVGDGALLRVGHEPLRAEDARDGGEAGHHARGRDGLVEVDACPLALSDGVDELLAPDDVRPGVPRLLHVEGVPREHRQPRLLPRAVGQQGGAANNVIRPLRVRREVDVDL